MLENYWNTSYPYNESHRNHFDLIDQNMLANHLAFVHDNSLKINQRNLLHDVELIQKCRIESNRMPILCLDLNSYDIETYLTELEKYVDPKNFFVFSPDSRTEQSTRSNVAPWPTFLINEQFQKNIQAGQEKKQRISFLSGTLRYHRLLLFRQIRPWIRDNDVVVINCIDQEQFLNILSNENNEQAKDWLNDLPWSNKLEYVDTCKSPDIPGNKTFLFPNTKHPAYTARINITGETLACGTQVFITEKTWKAYKSGCLVVNYGIQDMPTALENLGIEIWKEYDISESVDTKCKKIAELFQRDDIEDLYNQQRNMIDYNQNLVNSLSFIKKLTQPAVEKLQIHLN
jgi:hypothetical protein